MPHFTIHFFEGTQVLYDSSQISSIPLFRRREWIVCTPNLWTSVAARCDRWLACWSVCVQWLIHVSWDPYDTWFSSCFHKDFFFVFAFVFVCLWDSHTSVILLVIGPCSFRTNVSGKVSIYGIFCVYTLQRVQYFEYLFCAVCRKRCEMYSTPSTVLHSEVRTINCTSHSTHNALSFRLS